VEVKSSLKVGGYNSLKDVGIGLSYLFKIGRGKS
jgi:hypothetical protein